MSLSKLVKQGPLDRR